MQDNVIKQEEIATTEIGKTNWVINHVILLIAVALCFLGGIWLGDSHSDFEHYGVEAIELAKALVIIWAVREASLAIIERWKA